LNQFGKKYFLSGESQRARETVLNEVMKERQNAFLQISGKRSTLHYTYQRRPISFLEFQYTTCTICFTFCTQKNKIQSITEKEMYALGCMQPALSKLDAPPTSQHVNKEINVEFE
jgi:hypothetical protein